MKSRQRRNLLLGFLIIFCSTLLIECVSAIPFQPTPDSPYQNSQWDLTKGDIYGWNLSLYDDSVLIFNQTYYFRVNNTAKVKLFGMGDWYYAVQVHSMIYNQSLDLFFTNPSNSILLNVSLINFTNNQMYASQGGQPVTFFIPKSSNTQLMTEWVAEASIFQYKGYFEFASPPDISTTAKAIRYFNDTTEEYVELNYDSHGALISGEIFSKVADPGGQKQVITRIYGPPIIPLPPPQPNIPFGNYYLVIVSVCIISFIAYSRRKISYDFST